MTVLRLCPGTAALRDAGIPYSKVKAVVASYCYGEPTSGQRAVYELGLSGVPVFNVNNNCSSGSTALMMARRLVQSGVEDCVLALGELHTFNCRIKMFPEPFPCQHLLMYLFFIDRGYIAV